MYRADDNILLYLLNVSPCLIIFQFENLLWRTVDYKVRGGVWAQPQRIFFFSGILSYFIKPFFFHQNWRGSGTLLLGEGSNTVKPLFLDILSILRQFP